MDTLALIEDEDRVTDCWVFWDTKHCGSGTGWPRWRRGDAGGHKAIP